MADDNPDPIQSIFGTTLEDLSGQPNLVIDSPECHQLIWHLANPLKKEQDILVVTPFKTRAVGPDQKHFYFKFDPPVLTDVPTVQDWDVAVHKDEHGAIDLLYLAYAKDTLTLKPLGSQNFRLTYNSAIQEDTNSSQIRVWLKTGSNVTLANTQVPADTTYGPFFLNLIKENTPMLAAPPIAVDFIGRRTLINDGKTPNGFMFALTNMTEASIPLTPKQDLAVGNAHTTFTVWFDYAPDTGPNPNPTALTRKQNLIIDAKLDPGVPNSKQPTNWSAEKDAGSDPPLWNITVSEKIDLKPQTPVFFSFSGIVTDLDPGFTRMYLRFTNLSVYPTGVLIAELEKTPLSYGDTQGKGLYFFARKSPDKETPPPVDYNSGLHIEKFDGGPAAVINGGNVGIGTGKTPPETKLQIQDDYQLPDNGTLMLGPGNKEAGVTLRFGCQAGYSWIQAHGSKPLAINPLGNNVGIGTEDPGSRLSVAGGAAIGKSYAQRTSAIITDNILAVEGKVGIVTTDPGSSLSVAGGAAIGKSYAQRASAVITDNILAVEGKVGIVTTDPGSSLSVAGGAAIGKTYAQKATITIPDNTLAVEGSVGIGTDKPSNQLHVRSANGIRLGLDGNGGGQLLLSNNTKDDSTVYLVAASKDDNPQNQKSAAALYLGGYENPENNLPKLILNAKELDIQGPTTGFSGLGTGLLVSDIQRVDKTYAKVVEFGAGVTKEISAGKIGYQVFSDSLDIVGAGTTAGDRKIMLYDNIYVPGNIWQYMQKQTTWKALWASGSAWGTWYNDNGQPPGNQAPPSDRRLKTDVRTLSSPLDKVRRLSGVSFRWNEDALQRFTRDVEHTVCAGPDATQTDDLEAQQKERDRLRDLFTKTQVGVIAQDVEAVLPEAVTTGEDGYKSVNYNQLIALLIEAVKEQDLAVTKHAALAAQQQIEIDQLKQALQVARSTAAGKQ